MTYRYHATRQAFESDVARRRRSNHIAYTYGDVAERAAATIADLLSRLTPAKAAPRGNPDPAGARGEAPLELVEALARDP